MFRKWYDFHSFICRMHTTQYAFAIWPLFDNRTWNITMSRHFARSMANRMIISAIGDWTHDPPDYSWMKWFENRKIDERMAGNHRNKMKLFFVLSRDSFKSMPVITVVVGHAQYLMRSLLYRADNAENMKSEWDHCLTSFLTWLRLVCKVNAINQFSPVKCSNCSKMHHFRSTRQNEKCDFCCLRLAGVVGVAWCSKCQTTKMCSYYFLCWLCIRCCLSIWPTKTLKFVLHVFAFFFFFSNSYLCSFGHSFWICRMCRMLRILCAHMNMRHDKQRYDLMLTHFKWIEKKWNKNSNRQALKFTPIRVVHCGDWRRCGRRCARVSLCVCVRVCGQVYFPKHWITLERSSI